MVEASAHERMQRALGSRTRPAIELNNLAPGDEVDIFRPPNTKDESGWRGPAQVVELIDGGAAVRWQGRYMRVRSQDLRRSLAYVLLFMGYSNDWARTSPGETVVQFAESCTDSCVRLGWVHTAQGWRAARGNLRNSTVLW